MLEIDLRASYMEREKESAGQNAPGELPSQKLRDIVAQEQDYEIDLKDALGLR